MAVSENRSSIPDYHCARFLFALFVVEIGGRRKRLQCWAYSKYSRVISSSWLIKPSCEAEEARLAKVCIFLIRIYQLGLTADHKNWRSLRTKCLLHAIVRKMGCRFGNLRAFTKLLIIDNLVLCLQVSFTLSTWGTSPKRLVADNCCTCVFFSDQLS